MSRNLLNRKEPLPWRLKLRKTGFLFALLLATICTAPQAYGQSQRIDLKLNNATLTQALNRIRTASGQELFYNAQQVGAEQKRITVDYTDATVNAVLTNVLEGTSFTHKVENGTIVIVQRPQPATRPGGNITLTGTISDATTGQPVIGATVFLEGSTNGTITDAQGRFSLTVKRQPSVIVISHLGYQARNIDFTGDNVSAFEKVMLEPAQVRIEDVVVTGIYERKKESFTGSSQTYTTEDLKMVGNQNLIQSLKTLDPAFAVIENNQYGSDPNRVPDIEIRGKSSIVGFKEQFGEDPNQPLFILDGFETTLQTIMDLSLDRIGSVTILKDAASTAIYGAKAANGVIVVETVVPKQGQLRLSYNGSFDISFADLTEYNLMNAAEKLQFELESGNFKSNLPHLTQQNMERYNGLLRNVARGVDTYWMSEPLRTAVNQRHNVYVEGGDNQMRYGASINFSDIQGVMKKSGRRLLSGNLDLLYRYKNLTFSNKLTVDYNNTKNPVVPFSEYSRANPYYPKHNAAGGVDKWLETTDMYMNSGRDVPNPLWNDHLNSYSRGNGFGVRDNFNMEYRPFKFLYVRARVGLSKTTSEDESFRSPEDTSFDHTELLKKGSYSNYRSDSFSYNGDLTVTYGQLLREAHQINAVLGASISESTSKSKQFSAEGFPEGDFTTPAFSNKYPENGKPSYSDYKKRGVNFYFNGGYSYLNRYLLDVNLRSDGSSVFGSNKQFTTTWALGVAWNIHNEPFVTRNTDIFSMLKIRASIGNPGNQNFGSFNTITTYRFNNWLLNNFGTGILVDAFGDPDLEWQKTLDKNIGLDVSMLDNRLHLTFDYYHKMTNPLLAYIGIPLSVGVSSRLANIGKQVDKGFNGTLRYAVIYRPQERVNWTMSVNFRHGTAYYDEIGETLSRYNSQNQNKNLTRYYDGGSPTALWAVLSEGIDPATGREIFLDATGRKVFSYPLGDEVVVGDSRPTIEGVYSNALYWKGFSLNISVRYSLGAEAFNTTLYQKVENISHAELSRNQDKRALYDRWRQVGDKAKFKGISLTDQTRISSRFVQKSDYISLESIRVGYEFTQPWIKKIGLGSMTLSAYMNDLYRFATLKDERGIDYPFARSVSFALSLNF